MKQIAEAVLKYYPTNIESLSNISIVYMVQEKYDKALEVLLKAKKIDEKDGVILGNIAHTYKIKKDKENAIKYYKLVMQYGNDDTKKYAQEQIAELEKNK
jgi:tetratricopeptide (TPR) repeat protein